MAKALSVLSWNVEHFRGNTGLDHAIASKRLTFKSSKDKNGSTNK